MEDLVDIFRKNHRKRGSILEEIDAEENNKDIVSRQSSKIDFLDGLLDYDCNNASKDPFNNGYASIHEENEYLDNVNEALNGRKIEESSSSYVKYCDHKYCGYFDRRS